jgi:hypothetical protein
LHRDAEACDLKYATRYLGRLVPATALCLFASSAFAETIAETVTNWGLIGAWSADCALPKDHGKGMLLIYQATADGGVSHVRDFGDAKEENQVLSANVSKDGVLNLRVSFPALKQTNELGFVKLKDGTIRVAYNRDDKNHYSIKGSKFTFDGRPAPVQHKCEKPPG